MTAETAQMTAAAARPSRRRLLMLSLPVALVIGAGVWWVNGGRYESTDNAYFHQARITIASDISGRVTSVSFTDGQVVKKGEVLFTVDDQPYRLALAQANIAVDQARLQVAQLKGAYQAALAQEKVATDEAAYQADQLTRQQALSDKGVGTATALDEAQNTARRTDETAAVAKVTVENALTALGGEADVAVEAHPTVAAALAARDQAAYKLSLTRVTAPDDGVVYQATSFKPGQYLTAGASLFSFLPAGQVWVEANFKETQLAHLTPGQPAEVTFDVDKSLKVAGHVEAIGAGTGSEFSLIPAQNATGNWVKVTQRVPVRIVLDDLGALPVVSGMSAEASVDTGITRQWSDLIPGAGK
jgi:membrane fusion protein (multidrug efflux system)